MSKQNILYIVFWMIVFLFVKHKNIKVFIENDRVLTVTKKICHLQ